MRTNEAALSSEPPQSQSPPPPDIPLAHLAEAALTHSTAVTITVIAARQLPRGLLAPRALARIFSPFHEEPLAVTPPAPRSTAPEWCHTADVHLSHHPGAPPAFRIVLYDADAPIGVATLSLTAHYTRAWLPLADAGRADVHVEVRWPTCPGRMLPPPSPPPEAWQASPRSAAAAAAATAASDELRAVDCRPGALFRTGLIAVELVATGIPASVAQPFISVRTADQVLRAHEAPHSQEWWKRRRKAQADVVNEAQKPPLSPDSPPPVPPALSPDESDSAASSASPDSECYSTDDGSHPDVNKADKDGGLSSRPSLRRRLKKQSSNALHAVKKDGVRTSGKRALAGAKMRTLDAADAKLHAAATALGSVKPARSAVGATLTAAKIRRSPSRKREVQTTTTTPATVLQTLLAPRLRRAVDFGCFWFAELAGVDPQRLTITVTDNDSHLPNVVGSIFDADIPIVLCEAGESALLSACELGMARAKAAVWVRVTRIAAQRPPAARARAVTPRFRELIATYPAESHTFKERYPHAEGLIYLFVGGLFTNYYPLYYSRNVDFLQQSLRLPRVQIVPIHTESGLAANARVIAASVAKTATKRKSVVLVGHSKGAVDILEAISLHVEIIPFIYGVISFQAPFLGTYAIDVLERVHMTDAIGNILETMWDGQRESLLDMSYATRAARLEMFTRGPAAVANSGALALREIPVVAFATSASFELHNAVRTLPGVAGFASMAAIATAITRFTGFLCDGLVAPVDAIVPFCDYVYLDDMSHLEPALYVPGTSYPPGELTAAALALLFEKAERCNEADAEEH